MELSLLFFHFELRQSVKVTQAIDTQVLLPGLLVMSAMGTPSCVGTSLDRTEKWKKFAFPFLHRFPAFCLLRMSALLPAASAPSEVGGQAGTC